MSLGPVQADSINNILFLVAALGAIVASLGVVLLKNPIRATLCLILSFFPTALIYLLFHAPFVAILQILVYAGAILKHFTFVIMMVNPAPGGGEAPDQPERNPSRWKGPLLGGALLLVAGVVLPWVHGVASEIPAGPTPDEGFGGLTRIADLIFRNPSENPLTVSFELISLLILVGILAALNSSRRKNA
jgi:NADH-quinone oxidoreductase subunit J